MKKSTQLEQKIGSIQISILARSPIVAEKKGSAVCRYFAPAEENIAPSYTKVQDEASVSTIAVLYLFTIIWQISTKFCVIAQPELKLHQV